MLSAVENVGPGRIYNHPFAGPQSSLLQSIPLATSLSSLNSNSTSMSASEFAIPNSKSRYNCSSNGYSSVNTLSRSKYTEQNVPVNLALGPSSASNNNGSRNGVGIGGNDSTVSSIIKDDRDKLLNVDKLYSAPTKDVDVVGGSFSSASSRLYHNNNALRSNVAYQALNFNLYGNNFG